MVTIVRARRRSRVLTPSSLACLSVLPTINLTTGCLHNCLYCYIRGYRNYPGESRIVLYKDTLERLKEELRDITTKPHAVYFSPSSDLFQPAEEVLELSHGVLECLLGQGIGVAFLTKGRIPEQTMRLLIDNRDRVRAQIGIMTLDEHLASVFEPHAARPRERLSQLATLIQGGIQAEARIDPVLPSLTDSPEALASHFETLAQAGVKQAAVGILFLRPGILYWLRRNLKGSEVLNTLLENYQASTWQAMRGSPWPVQSAPADVRSAIFERIRSAAKAVGMELSVCACKNADIVKGTCNIAGKWPSRTPNSRQPALPLTPICASATID
ncbi:MAG TPA: radical SAM protein [Dehalococcoidia bacterium]|nr:radical SAM protein [Dehalococcoidia bacterium]